MKRKQWKALLTNQSKKCKHTRFVCEDCGSFFFQDQVLTKSRLKELLRAARRIKQIEKETGVSIDQL